MLVGVIVSPLSPAGYGAKDRRQMTQPAAVTAPGQTSGTSASASTRCPSAFGWIGSAISVMNCYWRSVA